MDRQDPKRELGVFFQFCQDSLSYISLTENLDLIVSLQCHKWNTIPTTMINVPQNSIFLDFDRWKRTSKISVVWPQLYEENFFPLQTNSRIFATDLNIKGYIIISVKATIITKISKKK